MSHYRQSAERRCAGLEYDRVHVIDNNTCLACIEVLPDEQQVKAIGSLSSASAGSTVVGAERCVERG